MFSEIAPKYWAKNIPVIPLMDRQKRPAINAWQVFATRMPTEEEQERWLSAYPNGNIGLPTGGCSGIVALDLDSEDPRVLEMLLKLMPKQMWKRVGKKGAVFAFKYNGERTYRIKDENNNTIFELLSSGTQVVLPPSIHPDTQMPYTANCDLLDVVDKLTTLPADFETMARHALIDMGFKLTSRGATKITEWVPAGGRDSMMVSHAGLLARAVLSGERTLMEALNEIELWVMAYTEKVSGDLLDPTKAREKVLEFIRRDVTERQKILPPNWAVGMTPDDKKQCQAYFGDDVEESTLEQINDFLKERFAAVPHDAVADRRAIVEEALMRISKSPNMSSLDVESALSFIVAASGKLVSMLAMRKRLKELGKTGIAGEDHTEIARELIKELELEGEVRFHLDQFHQWRGSHWVQLDIDMIYQVLAREFGHLPAARKRGDHKGIIQTVASFRKKPLQTDDVPGINFANGYLTCDLELLEHEPRFGATYVMPYRYVPDGAAASMFMSLVDQSWGEDEDFLDKVQALRESMAVTMFGLASRYSRAICLIGQPHSGKSVIMEVVRGMVPADSSSNVSPHDWGDKFLSTMMVGQLVNFCGEISETETIEGDRFKMVVEGAEMMGQYKGRDIFKFRPTCAQWFASNHLPRTRDTSSGFTRRWLFLTFNKPCPPDQKRVNFAKEILADEREAIAAWCIPAILDVMRRQDLTLPASHLMQVGEIANLNNSVRQFLKSGQVLYRGDLSVTEHDVYNAYLMYCRLVSHAQPMALSRFRTVIGALSTELRFDQRMVADANGAETTRFVGIDIVRAKPRT